MEVQFRGASRQFTLDTILSDQLQVPQAKIIWRTKALLPDGTPDPQNEELIQIASGGINIVSSRDARKNVRSSMGIALDLASQGMRVLYVNSYAGLELLRNSLKGELDRLDIIRQSVRNVQSNSSDTTTTSPIPLAEDAEFKSRFQILDVKMGMWDWYSAWIENALFEENNIAYHSEETVLVQKCDTLVINSYEFAAIDYRAKLNIATRLAKWLEKISLTVVIYTQEVKALMEAGVPVRGPLGLLTTSAATLAKVDFVKKGRTNILNEKDKSNYENVPNTDNKILYSEAA